MRSGLGWTLLATLALVGACTETPEPVDQDESSCVECHESEQMLRATAVEEPIEPESEAEGES